MNVLLIFVLFAGQVVAQKPKPTPELSREPHTTYRHWGGLYDVKIPHSCKHPKLVPLFPVSGVEQKKTCGVFVSFKGVIHPGTPYERLAYRTWDESETNPNHVYLYVQKEQAWRGITVYGRMGHKIMLEVTYQ